MKKTRVLLLLLLSTVCSFVAAAQTAKLANGTIIESLPCPTAPKRTYEQYREDTKKRSEEEVAEARRFSMGFRARFSRTDFIKRRI